MVPARRLNQPAIPASLSGSPPPSLPISLPLSWGIGYLIGMMSFRAALPLILSPWAVLGWLFLVAAGSVGASAYPARQAAQLTVRETLAYV